MQNDVSKMIHLTYWGKKKCHYFADEFSNHITLKNAFIFHFVITQT